MCQLSFAFRALGASAVLLANVAAQSVTSPAPGLRLFEELGNNKTILADDTGKIVHSWTSLFNAGVATHLLPDGTLLRSIDTGRGVIAGAGGGVRRLRLDGTVLWNFRYDGPGFLAHHDTEPMPNGNVLLLVWEDLSVAEAVASGRDPKLIEGNVFRPDKIVEIEPTGPASGRVVWEWRLWDHLIQDFDSNQKNFGDVGKHPELVDINFPKVASEAKDWNHCNGIDYDPVNDWIVISAAHQSEIWIIDHSTTTAQAAGHTGGRWGKGGDILYRWGNPQAYRAGTAADQTLNFQHDPQFIPAGRPGAGHLTLFNNRFAADRSAVFELVLPTDDKGGFYLGPNGRYGPQSPVWSYTADGFNSRILSGAERLPNGNTLVCSGQQGWLFEVDSAGKRVWEHRANGFVFHVHYVERSLWGNEEVLSAARGGKVDLDLIAGHAHAGRAYWILASSSGTKPGIDLGGVTLPLGLDSLFWLSLANANVQPFFTNTVGTLDVTGRARGRFTLPAGLVQSGLELNFAGVVYDTGTMRFLHATNAIPTTVTQQ